MYVRFGLAILSPNMLLYASSERRYFIDNHPPQEVVKNVTYIQYVYLDKMIAYDMWPLWKIYWQDDLYMCLTSVFMNQSFFQSFLLTQDDSFLKDFTIVSASWFVAVVVSHLDFLYLLQFREMDHRSGGLMLLMTWFF